LLAKIENKISSLVYPQDTDRGDVKRRRKTWRWMAMIGL
jgi:hypothetical protein